MKGGRRTQGRPRSPLQHPVDSGDQSLPIEDASLIFRSFVGSTAIGTRQEMAGAPGWLSQFGVCLPAFSSGHAHSALGPDPTSGSQRSGESSSSSPPAPHSCALALSYTGSNETFFFKAVNLRSRNC